MSDPLNAHSHDNNIELPDYNGRIQLIHPNGRTQTINDLSPYPIATIPTYSYTTDHGRHGPYKLTGVALRDLLTTELATGTAWTQAEVISADGYGNRIWAKELQNNPADPILLCTHSNGRELTRQQGAIRLVVPSETDNALRQIKWVQTIRVI